jgi:hypothetical protein
LKIVLIFRALFGKETFEVIKNILIQNTEEIVRYAKLDKQKKEEK